MPPAADSQGMTSPTAQMPPATTFYSGLQLFWRWLLSVLVVAASCFVAFWVGIIALIVTSGCFIECDNPDPGAGFLLQLATAAVCGGGLALNGAWWPRQRRGWVRAGGAAAVLVLVALTIIARNMLSSHY